MITPFVVFTSTTNGSDHFVSLHKIRAKSADHAAKRVRSIIRPSGEQIERKPRPWPFDGVSLTPNAEWPDEPAED